MKVAIAGDWHGNTKYALKAVDYSYDNDAELIVHVGDFSFDFQDSFLQPLNAKLKEFDLNLLFCRGNHDNPEYLSSLPISSGTAQVKSNIIYAPNNYRLTSNNRSVLFLGGAVSVDRSFRTPGKDWWSGETISMQEAEQAISDGYADVMICHDVPAGVNIKTIQNNPMGWPAHALREAEAHRELLRAVVDSVKPALILAGHYHSRESHLLKGKDYSTQVEILDCDQTPMDHNITFLEI